jgi:MerR family transcriptional regulator, thiopeptide resistance regulator
MVGMSKKIAYTVKQLAVMSGVSVRTLHFYDRTGLLKAARNPANGYRIYDQAAVLRLQQILFLRELDLSLEQIRSVIDRPDFDLLDALEQHREALHDRQARLGRLLQTVDRWHKNMRCFYEPTPEILLGLSQGYVEDPEFNATFQRIHP